jgi:four helix bundle protein
METYKDLKAWRKSMDLVDTVYSSLKLLPKTETYELGAQIRSAATSIPSNIAEGKGRRTLRDYRHFVIQARGSAYELETEVLIAYRQHFFDDATKDDLVSAIAEVCRAINGLIAYLDKKIGDFDHPDT